MPREYAQVTVSLSDVQIALTHRLINFALGFEDWADDHYQALANLRSSLTMAQVSAIDARLMSDEKEPA